MSKTTSGADMLRPHSPLPDYYATDVERDQFIARMFNDTASDYDRIETLLALGSGRWYRRKALERGGLTTGAKVLDVGIGTGLVAREALTLIGPQGTLVGVDPSPGMMGEVKLPGIELLTGRAEAIPQPDNSADFLSMGFALRHINDLSAAFTEFHRVVRPGGRVLVLEITKPKGRLGTWFLKAYMRLLVPLLARFVGDRKDTALLWRYYWDTIEACIPPDGVLAALRAAGFKDVERHLVLGIFSEYRAVKPG